MKAVAHSPIAAASPASRWRLRGAAALMGAVLLTTSCWGTGSETPSPTVSSSPESSPPPTPPAQITATWEVTVAGSGPLLETHEGLVVAPDLAAGGSKLRMLNWADGSEVWSVDVSSDLAGFDILRKVPDTPPGQVAMWAESSQQQRTLFVYSTTDGSLIGRLDEEPERYLAMAASGAIYEMDSSNEGTVRISRASSVKEAHTKQWSFDLPEEDREWFWVREHDGVTDFCVDGQAGPVHEYACYLSVHTDDGSPVVKDGVRYRSAWVGNVLAGRKNDGTLKGFDQQGKELWTVEVEDGYPLGWGDDLIYVTGDGAKLCGPGPGDRERALAQGLGRRPLAHSGFRQDSLPSGRPPERGRSVPFRTDGGSGSQEREARFRGLSDRRSARDLPNPRGCPTDLDGY